MTDWQSKRKAAQEKVLEWVSKYDTGNDPECLKFLLLAYKEHCAVEEDYEKYLAASVEPLNDWRACGFIGGYFRVKDRAGNWEYHQVAQVGTVMDTEGNQHLLTDCQFGFWTQEEIDKANLEAKIMRRWLVDDSQSLTELQSRRDLLLRTLSLHPEDKRASEELKQISDRIDSITSMLLDGL